MTPWLGARRNAKRKQDRDAAREAREVQEKAAQHHVEEKQRKRRTDERKHHPMWIAFASAAWPSSAKAKSTN